MTPVLRDLCKMKHRHVVLSGSYCQYPHATISLANHQKPIKSGNPDFKRIDFDTFKEEAGTNAFVFSIKNWTDELGAIGLFTKSGRYGGGIYAHIDIVFEFAS